MKQLRTLVLPALALLVAAIGLTSCSTPATGFHFVDAQPAQSRANVGELQMFAGDHTLEANDKTNVADLHWVITYGSWLNPAATELKTADGVATVPVTFTAPDNDKRFYRICLSSIAQPLLQTCQTVAVGNDALWSGNWAGGVFGMTTTQAGHNASIQLFVFGHNGPSIQGPLDSPFLLLQSVNGQEIWFEWVSYVEIRAFGLPTGTAGSPTTTSFYRQS